MPTAPRQSRSCGWRREALRGSRGSTNDAGRPFRLEAILAFQDPVSAANPVYVYGHLADILVSGFYVAPEGEWFIGTRWVDPLEVAYAPTWTNTVQLPPSLCPALQIDERFTGEAQSRSRQVLPRHRG